MTKKALEDCYSKLSKINKLNQTRIGLQEYMDSMAGDDFKDINTYSIQRGIDDITSKILELQTQCAVQQVEVKNFLQRIEDDTARISLMLHYYEGLTWDLVAKILKTGTNAIKTYSYRYLKKNLLH